MVKIEGLTKYYGDFLAVDDISFEIKKGEILGLLGPNGAGKSTTLRILTCYLDPSKGTIHVKDHEIGEDSLEIKKVIGYLPESAPLYPDMLVFDYLMFIAGIRQIEPDKRLPRIRKLSSLCGLDNVMHKSIHELSKGYKQRVGLAHAMMDDPEILVLDEPTSGLDPNQIIEIRHIIKEIGKEKTVILSTHILSEAEATCDRVVIINKGNIVADSSIKDLKNYSSGDSEMHISIQLDDFKKVKDAFSGVKEIKKIKLVHEKDGIMDVSVAYHSDKDIRLELYEIIKQQNWDLLEFHTQKQSLENIFRELTQEA
jgi:ABC-2 type transport system ATP-binding protein